MGKNFKLLLFIALFLFSFPTTSWAYSKEAGEAAKLASGTAFLTENKPDKRVIILQNYLESVQSPLSGYAEIFVKEADEHGLDWRLVPSIAGLESSFGKRIPLGSYNPFGWGIYTGRSSGIMFDNWEHAIHTVSKGIKENYVNDGLITVEAIGSRYASSTTWAQRINVIMNKFETHTNATSDVLALTL